MKYIVLVILFSFFITIIGNTSALTCNGMSGLCDLRINQVTFPGAHNAGAGFNGDLHSYYGAVAPRCSYKNVDKNFKQMLDFGIRFFDIDTCLWHYQLESCHNNAYAGALRIAFDQIDRWMKSHPNEVIILNFNRDITDHRDKSGIAHKIIYEVEKRWNPYKSSNQVKFSKGSKWPTLREAINSRQRIFIFMDNHLWQYVKSKSYLYRTNGFYRSSWRDNMNVSPGGCGVIIDAARENCGTDDDMIELAAFGKAGLCVWDMAWHCSNSLQSALDTCYAKRQQKNHKTVNVILVDYPASNYHYGNDVVTKARYLNEKNVRQYSTQMQEEIAMLAAMWMASLNSTQF